MLISLVLDASFVEENLLTTNHASLQCMSNSNSFNRALEADWRDRVIETACRELRSLSDEGFSEPVIVMLGKFTSGTKRVMNFNMILSHLHVHTHRALLANYLAGILLTCRHHPTTIQRSNPSTLKLDCGNRIVSVVARFQSWVDSTNTHGLQALDLPGLTQEPEHQINVVNRAVHEDATACLRILEKEIRGIVHIRSLRSEQNRSSELSSFDSVVSLAVRCVEATGEATHHFLVGVNLEGLLVGIEDGLSLKGIISVRQIW